jgi:hypothetical protein
LKDPKDSRKRLLEGIMVSCASQIEEWEDRIEETKAFMPAAKTPSERTSMNIILDDQRKLLKALSRLHGDISEMLQAT